MSSSQRLILGSQSPQRRALLQTLLHESQLQIIPPQQSEEAGFEGLRTTVQIEQRLQEIASTKNADVLEQCPAGTFSAVLTADTVVVVNDKNSSHVLGKPDGPHWQETVREWFSCYYWGKSHQVLTAVSLSFPDGSKENILTKTTVCFREPQPELLDWYLETQEPLGKAGGYGIQSAGSLFVESITGSVSNVIGLPLEDVWRILNSRKLT